MDSYYNKIAAIDREIAKNRESWNLLNKTRENLIVAEVHRTAVESCASSATQIARALIAVNTQNEDGPSIDCLFWMQSPEVNTAGLLQMAEWRDAETIEIFLKNGADVNGEDDQGFTVLEMVLQGHDGYWRGESKHWNPEVFKVLAKYKVNRYIQHGWIIPQCCDGAPQYVRDFLGLDEDEV
jgi:hypothetical protein